MYGTLIDNKLQLAPRSFMLHGAMVVNPRAEHFAVLNAEREKQGKPPYLPLVDKRPSTDAALDVVFLPYDIYAKGRSAKE